MEHRAENWETEPHRTEICDGMPLNKVRQFIIVFFR